MIHVNLFLRLNNYGIKQISDKSINKIVPDNKEVTDFRIVAEHFNNHFYYIVEKHVTGSELKQHPFIPTNYVNNMSMVKYQIKHTFQFLKEVVNLS